MKKIRKIRVNISVDKNLLDEAKKKLNLFGGKLSTLFNAYLADFVNSFDKSYREDYDILNERIDKLEKRIEEIIKNRKMMG